MTIKIASYSPKNPVFQGIFYAQQKGYLKDVNLDVELLKASDNKLKDLRSGKLDFIVTTTEKVLFDESGDLVILNAFLKPGNTSYLIFHPDGAKKVEKMGLEAFSFDENNEDGAFLDFLESRLSQPELFYSSEIVNAPQRIREEGWKLAHFIPKFHEPLLKRLKSEYEVISPDDLDVPAFQNPVLVTTCKNQRKYDTEYINFGRAAAKGYKCLENDPQLLYAKILEYYSEFELEEHEVQFMVRGLIEEVSIKKDRWGYYDQMVFNKYQKWMESKNMLKSHKLVDMLDTIFNNPKN